MVTRPPTRADAEAVLAVCIARDVADIGRPDYTLDDLLGDWENPAIDVEKDCFVVEDGSGTILGYAMIDHRGAFAAVHPDHEGRGAGTALREALEARARERGQEPAQVVVPTNRAAVAHLEAAGYRRAYVYLRMRADLASAATGAPREGIRRFDLETEGHAVHELIEDAFTDIVGNVREPFDAWLSEMRRTPPEFRLAVDGEDGLAGVLTAERWPDGVGYVREIAVARDARGRGLGRDLLLAAFEVFRAHGLTSAELSVQGENPAKGLYESAGMTEDFRQERWRRA